MANVIKHKRGSGSDPVASDLVVGEVAIRTDVGKLFTKMDNGTVAEIAGGGSDIAINTLSSSSATGGGSATFNGSAYRFTLSAPPSVSAQQLLVSINGVIQKPVAGTGQPSEGFSVDGTDIILGDAPATGSDFFILTFKSLGVSEPADNSVTSAKIIDGAIVNADINASAAIARTKLANVDVVDDTSPQLGGDLDTNDNAIRCSDSNGTNNQITFGDSNDLQIRHQSNSSYITNATGNLNIGSNNQVRIKGGNDVAESMAIFKDNGSVELYHDNSKKFETTSAGIAATGDVQLTNFLKATGDLLLCADIDNDNSGTALRFCVDGDQSAEKMRIDDNGNVGIGTTSPGSLLELNAAAGTKMGISLGAVGDNITASRYIGICKSADQTDLGVNSGFQGIEFGGPSSTNEGYLAFHTHDFGVESGERLRIDKNGNVGIGRTNPGTKLDVGGAGTFRVSNSTAYQTVLNATNSVTTDLQVWVKNNAVAVGPSTASDIHFVTQGNSNTRMIVQDNGNVGIGTTGPSAKLYIAEAGSKTGGDINLNADGLVVDNSGGNTGITFKTPNTASSRIAFGDPEDNNAGQILYSQASNYFAFDTSGSERMIINSSGNVGINESSNINGRLHVQHDALAENIVYATRYNQQSTDKPIFAVTEAQMTNFPDSGTIIGNHNRDIFIGPVFQDTGAVDTSAITKGICLRSSGRVGIGTTSPDLILHVTNTSDHATGPCFINANGSNNVSVLLLKSMRAATSSGIGGEFIAFLNASGSKIGSVTGENSTSYNTTSDYRLKENVVAISDGITRLKTLKPSRFNWKTNPSTTVDGFLAHEVTAVPEAITGTKDEVDENNEPVYQGIDQSKLVPLLVAALQEAIGRIEVLEAK